MALVGVGRGRHNYAPRGGDCGPIIHWEVSAQAPGWIPKGGVTSPLDGLTRASAVNVGERYR